MYPLPAGQKECKICEVAQSIVNFAKHPTTYDRLDHVCMSCKRIITRERRKINPEKYRDSYRTNIAGALLASAKSRAKQRGLAFDLTKDWIEKRVNVCELSGVRMIPMNGPRCRPSAISPSIDKINARGGYTQDNCRVICFALNAAFQDWGAEAVEPIVKGWMQRLATANNGI